VGRYHGGKAKAVRKTLREGVRRDKKKKKEKRENLFRVNTGLSNDTKTC